MAWILLEGRQRPDGLTLIPWSKGKSIVWNFTASDTLASSHVQQTSQDAAKFAAQAETKKLSHYQNLSSGYIIMPVAMKTLGVNRPNAQAASMMGTVLTPRPKPV